MRDKKLLKSDALFVKDILEQQYISHEDLAEVLGIQGRTLADIRRTGILYYTEVTAKHFIYHIDDVLEFLKSKRIKKEESPDDLKSNEK
jgi:hypothetical protein